MLGFFKRGEGVANCFVLFLFSCGFMLLFFCVGVFCFLAFCYTRLSCKLNQYKQESDTLEVITSFINVRVCFFKH